MSNLNNNSLLLESILETVNGLADGAEGSITGSIDTCTFTISSTDAVNLQSIAYCGIDSTTNKITAKMQNFTINEQPFSTYLNDVVCGSLICINVTPISSSTFLVVNKIGNCMKLDDLTYSYWKAPDEKEEIVIQIDAIS
jgi:hypothetical protein